MQGLVNPPFGLVSMVSRTHPHLIGYVLPTMHSQAVMLELYWESKLINIRP